MQRSYTSGGRREEGCHKNFRPRLFSPCSSFRRRRRRKPPVNDALDFPSYIWLLCYRCYSLSLFTAAVSVGVLQVSKGELATANSNRVTFCVVPRLANHRCPYKRNKGRTISKKVRPKITCWQVHLIGKKLLHKRKHTNTAVRYFFVI